VARLKLIKNMGFPLFIVDAFVGQLENRVLRGNPAGVILLDGSQTDSWLASVAAEVNHAETAFIWSRGDGEFDLRWFTPEIEVDLCGHATLGAAHLLWENGEESPELTFHTRSGVLKATRRDGRVTLDFPIQKPSITPQNLPLLQILGLSNLRNPVAFLRVGDDLLLKVASGSVEKIKPDFAKLRDLSLNMGIRGVVVTELAPEGAPYDFTSRFFGPAVGINEDHVTGSAHCGLAPFWANRFPDRPMIGYQASSRGGFVVCEIQGERVRLSGQAKTAIRGELLI
jgi:PhzF family phenazine biosynthesis protein